MNQQNKDNDNGESLPRDNIGPQENKLDTAEKPELETNRERVGEDELKDVEMIKCPRCGKETPKSVRMCMFCGYDLVEKPYIPMDKKKTRIIKWAIGIPLVIAFLIWFIITRT